MASMEGGGANRPQASGPVGLAGEPRPAGELAPDGAAGRNGQDDAAMAEAVLASTPELIAGSLGEYGRIWAKRVRSGESGALPVVIGLVAIVVYFQVRNSLFLSSINLVNLMTQAAWIVMLGMAEVFVLLLGEIDLSIGFTSVIGAVITLWLLSLSHPVPWWVAVLAGLATPAAYGAIQGFLITKLRLPSFVVTLAGLLMGQGLLLYLIGVAAPGSGGVIRLSNSVLNDIEGGSMSVVAGWVVMAAAVALGGVFLWLRDSRRRSGKLAAPPASVTLLKVAVMAIAGVVVVLIGNTDRGVGFTVLRGVPWVVLVVLVVLVAWSVLLSRTRFGRYIYAIGGNAEAARRAGISLGRIRLLAFTLCGLTAGIMGIIYASFQGSISSNVNGGQLVLYAIAAAVIGGTSLFGGRGRMLGAVLGGLIVAVIYNGLSLLGLGAAAQDMWTAVVLLAAVMVDTLARRGRTTPQ
ncbi:MAG TPA: ABC transporter permease [Streptosporangiaceae bacterium]